MAFHSLHLFLVLSVICHTIAIQVAPGSPCSSLCIDSSTSDPSDPSSSSTGARDIVCEDSDLTGTSTGTKWEKCISCLQNSTYSQGAESDQEWFLYNLRYSFDYCVFAYPDGKGSGSNPCETSTACGTLKTTLEYDNLTTTSAGSDEFGYCDAGGGGLGAYYQACLNCVSAGGDTNYIANALVALEAGCEQTPNTTDVLGLSDSVFSSDVIQIIDPATLNQTSSTTTAISTVAIVGIAVGAVALLLLTAAIIFFRCRRRKNRAGLGGKPPRWDKAHKRRSSFSFKCRNILASPLSPRFFSDLTPVEEQQQAQQQYGSLDAQLSGVPVAGPGAQGVQGRYYIETTRPRGGGGQRHPYETSLEGTRAHDAVQDPWSTTYAFSPSSVGEKKTKTGGGGGRKGGGMTINTTDAGLAPPPAAHQSPRADEFGISPTPAPAPPYQPSAAAADYYSAGGVPPTSSSPVPSSQGRSPRPKGSTTTMSSQGSGYPSLQNRTSASPLLRQQQQRGWLETTGTTTRENTEPWFPPPPPSGPPPSSSSSRFGRKVSPGTIQARRGKRESGSPVESKQIKVSFPAPPQR